MIAAVLSLECAKTCSAVVCREDVWAANAEKRCQLPKSKLAGSQILEKLGSKRGEEMLAAKNQVRGKPNTREVGQQARRRGVGCTKVSPREVKYSRSWAASVEKRCRLPKSKLAGSQIHEKLGSKRGEEVPAAQNQARGKSIEREVGQQAWRRGTGCPKPSSREAKYSRSRAASEGKRCQLPKSKLAGS